MAATGDDGGQIPSGTGRVLQRSHASGSRALFELAMGETAPGIAGTEGAGWTATTPSGKVEIPRVASDVLVRGRLLDRLTECVSTRRVTLVAAPAGFGKSTLLTSWSPHAEATIAWLTLDEFDNDPRRLFRGQVNALQAAVRRVERSDGNALLALLPRFRVDLEQHDALLVALDELTAPLVLILDDVHEVDDVAALEVIGRLIRFAPSSVHIILSSRSDPNLPLHKRRLDGDLGELRAEALGFTRAEVEELAVQSGLALDPGDLDGLLEMTGGWPVALRMALVGLTQAADPREQLRTMGSAGLPLTGYLTDEILGMLAPDLAEFILHATTSDQITTELALALRPDGPGLLEECVRLGVFLAPTGGTDEHGYRWHPLFASQCRAILHRTDPDAVLDLRRRVARYWGPRDVPEAVSLAVAGHDPRYAVELLRTWWPDLLLRGESVLLRRLCAQLPAPESHDAEILVVLSMCEYMEGLHGAAGTLALARARAEQLPRRRRRHFDLVDALLQLFVTTERPDMAAAVDRVRALLPSTPPGDLAVLAFGHFLLGEAESQLQRDPTAALNDLRIAAGLSAERELSVIAFASTAAIPMPLFLIGQFNEAVASAQEAIEAGQRAGLAGSSALAPAHLICGAVQYWRDHLGDARIHLEEAIRLASARQAALKVHGAMVLLMVAIAGDDVALIESARRIARGSVAPSLPPASTGFLAILDALYSDARGDLAAALEHVRSLGDTERHPVALVWESNFHRRGGDHTAARAALARIPSDRRVAQVEVGATLTEALLDVAEGDRARAHRRLESALVIASETGIRRPFMHLAIDLGTLLSEHLAWGTQHGALAGDLLAQFRGRTAVRHAPSFWELTERELTVLTYMRSPMTAAEIGGSLFVTANTVKTHMRAVYRKLGANGRRDAVRIALERDLI